MHRLSEASFWFQSCPELLCVISEGLVLLCHVCRYARNARSIKNSLRLNNTLSLEEEVAYLREMVVKLQAENAELKAKL